MSRRVVDLTAAKANADRLRALKSELGLGERQGVNAGADVKWFSGPLVATKRTVKAADGSDTDGYFVSGIASSSVIDRTGDRINDSCQASMLSQARGMTMFLNHSYDVPEDVFGTCSETTLTQATDPEQGACLDLHIECEVEQENARAMKAWRMVQNGRQLAFSVGIIIKDAQWGEQDEFEITDVELLEISCVGIPANQRAVMDKNYLLATAKSVAAAKRAGVAPKPKDALGGVDRTPTDPDVAARALAAVGTYSTEGDATDPDAEDLANAGALATALEEPDDALTGEPPATDPNAGPVDPQPQAGATTDGTDPALEGEHIPADPAELVLRFSHDSPSLAIAKALVGAVGVKDGQPDDSGGTNLAPVHAALGNLAAMAAHGGLCGPLADNHAAATSSLQSMLPENQQATDTAKDNQIGEDGDTVNPDGAYALRAALKTATERATTAEAALVAQAQMFEAETAAKVAAAIAETENRLKATPAGRRTRDTFSATGDSGSPTSPSLDPEQRKRDMRSGGVSVFADPARQPSPDPRLNSLAS